MKHLAFWLFLITGIAMFTVYGTQYVIDVAQIGSLKVEVRSSTQCAATYAFQEISLEGVSDRRQEVDRAHRIVLLNKTAAYQAFVSALKDNMGLDSNWTVVNSKYLRVGMTVEMKDLQIIDSSDLPFTYSGRTYNEPTVLVVLNLPVKTYLFKEDYIEVTRVIPFRTFITNRQIN